MTEKELDIEIKEEVTEMSTTEQKKTKEEKISDKAPAGAKRY